MSNSLSRRGIFRAAGSAVLALLGRLWSRPGSSTVIAHRNQGLGVDYGKAAPLLPLNPVGQRFTFTYSSSGSLLSRTEPSGKITFYDWQPRNQDRPEPVQAQDDHSRQTEQIERVMSKTTAPTVAFGPTMPGWGS